MIVDPSHAAGRRDWVQPMSLAAAAAGADGIIVEVHNEPDEAICDGPQAIATERFAEYAEQLGRRGAGNELAGWSRRALETRMRIAVLGVGLIGGSIGLAARRRLGAEVAASTRTRRRARARAGARGARPAAARSPRRSPAPRWSSAPRRWARCRARGRGALEASGDETVITDVGSTKRGLLAALPRRRTGSGSSAATRWPAPRPPGSRTRAPTCSRGRAGT